MHELPMTQSALEIVLTHAAEAGAARVTAVHFVVGELSGVEPECVAFHWEILSRGTPAEGARLEFRRPPFTLVCLDCDAAFTPTGAVFDCARCGGSRVRVGGGDELRVEAIDVEGVAEATARA
jgi:hydrogenase nickel incorporation protein HypA/HybF